MIIIITIYVCLKNNRNFLIFLGLHIDRLLLILVTFKLFSSSTNTFIPAVFPLPEAMLVNSAMSFRVCVEFVLISLTVSKHFSFNTDFNLGNMKMSAGAKWGIGGVRRLRKNSHLIFSHKIFELTRRYEKGHCRNEVAMSFHVKVQASFVPSLSNASKFQRNNDD